MENNMRRELETMPVAKVFGTESGEKICNATGWEVCEGNSSDPADWWNEYEDSEGNLYYGR